MMNPFKAKILMIDDETLEVAFLGTVVFQEKYMIQLISVNPAQPETMAAWLADWVERMNEKTQMHVRVPPPKDSPMFSNYGRSISRDSDEFFLAFQDFVKTYYDIEFEIEA